MPSEEDIVLARIRTTGIREERLKVCIILLLLMLSMFLLLMLLLMLSLLLLMIRLTIKYFNFLMLVDKETKEENGLIVLMVCFTYQDVIVIDDVDVVVVVVGVHGVMFVTAISEFDQKLFESDSVNRMVESLDLFEQIVNENAFVNAAMILFLNKSDLYEEKVCCC